MSDVLVNLIDQTQRVETGEGARPVHILDAHIDVGAPTQKVAVARREEVVRVQVVSGGGGGSGGGDAGGTFGPYEDVAQFGVSLDGSAGQTAALEARVAAAAADGRTVLTGKGTFLVDQHLDLSKASFDFGAVMFRAKPNLRPALAPGEAAIEIGGVPVSAGGVFGNSFLASKTIWFFGDSANNGYVIGTDPDPAKEFVAVSMTGDQGPMNRYVVAISGHNGTGLRIQGDSEKKNILLLGYQVSGPLLHLAPEPGDADGVFSPDEINILISAASLKTAYKSDFGFQVSTTVTFNVEQCRPSPGEAAVLVGGGKVEAFTGEFRGNFGTLFRIVREGEGSGSGGADVLMRDMAVVQAYDGPALELINAKNMGGSLFTRIAEPNRTAALAAIAANPGWTDTQKALAYAADGGAAYILQSCQRTYGLFLQLERCKAQYGVQIGRVDGPLGSVKRMLGHRIPLAIYMGDDNTSPWLYTAVRINGAGDCIVDATYGLKGNIQVDADVENTVMLVKGDWVKEGGSIEVHPFASFELRIETPLNSFEIFDRDWLFPGVVVTSVPDMGGGAYRYDGEKWVSLGAPLAVSDVQMSGLNSLVNTLFKGPKVPVFNAEQALLFMAQGPAKDDVWQAGALTVTPALTAQVGAFQTRVTAAGGGTMPDAWRDAMDRMMIDLIDRGLWTPATITTSPLKALWIFCAPNAATARLNVLFDQYNASAVNGPTHTAYAGYSGNDVALAHLDFGWNVASTPHGCTINNFHLGAFAGFEGSESQTSTPDIGGQLTSWQIRAHRFDGGNNVRMGTSTGVAVPFAPLPRHVIGVRAADGNQYGFGSNMVPVSGSQVPSTGLPTALYGLRAQTTYSNDLVRMLHAGAALSVGQARDLISILSRVNRVASSLA